MKHSLFMLLMLLATPAHAERLMIDYRSYAPLKTVMDSGRDDAIYYEDASPRYILDRIVIDGNSPQDWREALEITVSPRGKRLRSASEWFRQYQQAAPAACPGDWATLADEGNALTFERKTGACPPAPAQTGLYRVMLGRKTVFLVNLAYKGQLTDTMRQQWQQLLATTHLEP